MKTPLVYIHNGTSTFVEKDIQILKMNYSVKVFHFKTLNKYAVPFQFLNELIFLTKNLRSKLCVVQFAGYHSFLPIIFKFLFRKKCIIVLGGSDCVSFPSIKSNQVLIAITCLFALKPPNFLSNTYPFCFKYFSIGYN